MPQYASLAAAGMRVLATPAVNEVVVQTYYPLAPDGSFLLQAKSQQLPEAKGRQRSLTANFAVSADRDRRPSIAHGAGGLLPQLGMADEPPPAAEFLPIVGEDAVGEGFALLEDRRILVTADQLHRITTLQIVGKDPIVINRFYDKKKDKKL